MLQSMHNLRGYRISATDGEIGTAHEFFFDDMHWTVRYLIVDTGSWLPGRRVLISPHSVERPDHDSKTIPVSLTVEQVRNAPDVDTDQPVSRQQETAMSAYYGWPAYWGPDNYLPPGMHMPAFAAGAGTATAVRSPYIQGGDPIAAEGSGPNLRSSREVAGYRIQANDAEIGHVEDFILDDDGWAIRYMVIDTRNLLPGGKKVLVAPQWIEKISWADRRVYVDSSRERIAGAPSFDGTLPLSRSYELALFKHYGRQQYWT